ncbi:hypothetical protein BBP40_005164 [Aspergillus hancockii]|nr:hypothetical protein BBP40_005164 [Aspergillus hancockii]
MTEKAAFDDTKLTFEGISRVLTWGGINRSPLTGVRHTFMKVHHPIKNGYQPGSILEPSWCYEIPFTFVVPDGLPLMASDHKADHAGIKQAYTRLSPSMCTETATERCCIQYMIRVTIPRKLCGSNQRTGNLVNVVQPVKLLSSDTLKSPGGAIAQILKYRKELEIKHDRREKHTGHLAISASCTTPIRLLIRDTVTSHVDASIILDLTYRPVGNELPPRLRKVYPTLNMITSFSEILLEEDLSSPQKRRSDLACGTHVQPLTLRTMSTASIHWIDILPLNTGAVLLPQACHSNSPGKKNASYSSSIIVPISLPKHNDLVPSFVFCSISRVYTLELVLCYSNDTGRGIVRREAPIEITM